MPDWMQVETHPGRPLPYRGGSLTPFSESVTIRVPGLPAGLVWSRPVSVLAVTANGQEEVLPVIDVTRQVILTLVGSVLLTAILTILIGRRKDQKK